MTIEVRVIDSISSVDDAACAELVARTNAPVFYSGTFLRAYEESPLQSTKAIYYLEVRDGSRNDLIALVPAYLQEIDDPVGDISALVPRPAGGSGLMLLSHVVHCYDGHFPALELTPRIVSCLTSALGRLAAMHGADFVGFLHLEAGGELARLLRAAGFALAPMATRFRLDMSGLTAMEDYIRGVPSQHARRRLRRDRRLADQMRVTVHSGPGSAALLAEIADLCHRNATRHGTPEYYHRDRLLNFLLRLDAALQVVEIRHAGALIAAGACLVDRQRFHLWACGLNDGQRGLLSSPYTLLFYESVRTAIESGCPMLEAGRGNEPYKTRFGFTPLATVGAVAVP
jgi:predicted N-acyltransferase